MSNLLGLVRPYLAAPIRVAVVLAACAAPLLSSSPAAACGIDTTEFSRPVVDPSSGNAQADALFAEARRIETRASTVDARAREMDRRADEQATEARALRLAALDSEGGERVRLLNLADTLAQSSVAERSEARRARDESNELRVEANALRRRANQIAGIRPPGWNRRVVDHRMPMDHAATNI